MDEQTQNVKYTGKDSFNLRVKTLTYYRNKNFRPKICCTYEA